MKNEELINFKKLLEYFVSHLEWIETNDENIKGYDKYIRPLIEDNSFKITGQGYDGAGIQNQISNWDEYESGKVCINIQGNYGSYKSVKCYLNWIDTGINILARWSGSRIVSLYQDEFIYWEKPTRRVSLNIEYSLEELNIFGDGNLTNELSNFYQSFVNAHEKLKQNEKKKLKMKSILAISKILNYKKQIILQGPPGTGKTREAKNISREMIALSADFIKNKITVGKIIPTATGQVSYKVVSIEENEKIILERERGTTNNTTISRIITAFEERRWNNEITNNDDRMAVAIAKYLYDDFFTDNEQFKLIQFHPSYTYEDFVRGIVAESKGDKIEYKNVNKTLGEFAELALKNYNDSKKNVNELSTEKWIDDEFNQFVDEISQTLEKEKIVLSDNVDLVDLMDDAFLYIGENWKGYEHRMSFKDIKRAYLDNNLTRQDIVKNINLSGSARQHATYYIVVLKKFREFLSGKKAPTNQIKINEHKYILVIDEINRANLSSVLGELIYALEYRGEEVESMYSVDNSLLKNKLILPPNLYIIGTMNTADRSVGHIDYAIRRRFAFVEVLPKDLTTEMGDGEFYTDLFSAVKALFTKDDYQTKSDYLSQEFEPKDVALGHSYFIDKTKDGGDIKTRWNYEIKPILLEYIRDGVLKESALEQVISIETTFDLKIQ